MLFILINIALFTLHLIGMKKVFAGNSEKFTMQWKCTKLPTGARTLTGSGPWTRLVAYIVVKRSGQKLMHSFLTQPSLLIMKDAHTEPRTEITHLS